MSLAPEASNRDVRNFSAPDAEIDLCIWFAVTNKLGRKDNGRRQARASRQIDQQRQVAVGQGTDHEVSFETREAGRAVRPRLEPMPGSIQLAYFRGPEMQASPLE